MAILSLSSLLLLASPALATDISLWFGLAATQIQSKIFLTGGWPTWGNWSNDGKGFGSSGQLDFDTFTGVLYSVDLKQSMNLTQNDNNTSAYVVKSNMSMNTAMDPGYSYGAMFSNDYSWYTFG